MKYYGKIGFAVQNETAPSVWTEEITERPYYGEVLRAMRKSPGTEHLNDDILQVSNRISIVADPYAFNNFATIRYVEWMNAKWKVNNVEVAYPRLHLEIGGVYNEE